MDKRLLLLINSYLVVAMIAKGRMEEHGINIPASKAEWQSDGIPQNASLRDGITFTKSEYGCTVTFIPGPITLYFSDGASRFGLTLGNLLNFAGNDCGDYGFNGAADLAYAFTSAIADGYLELGESGLAYLKPEYSYV